MEFFVENLGQEGLNTDRSPVGLPPNVWTEIINGRSEDGKIGPGMGWVLWNGSVPNTAATWLLFAVRQDVPYWFIAGDNAVYLWDGSSYTQVNQTIPAAPLNGRWSGIFDGDIPYFNHFEDAPQYADFPDPSYFVDPTLKDVVYDPNGSPGNQTFRELNYRVRVLRAHKGFLFAGGYNKNGTDFDSLLEWDAGTAANVPSSNWVPGTDNLAGGFDCVDSGESGRILDMLSLRDDLIIYKENSAWIARRTGGTAPAWGLKKLIGIPGIIAQDCVLEEKGTHYVWSPDDIIVHQGQTARSIIDNRARKTFINQISQDNYLNCFAFKNFEKKEMCFAGPTQGNTYPNKVLKYNWVNDTFDVDDLPECSFIETGVRTEARLTWADLNFPWDAANFQWGQRNFSPLDKAIIGVQRENQDLLQFDVGKLRWNGSESETFFTRFERTGVPMGGMKAKTRIKELVFGAAGTGKLSIYVGKQDRPNGPVAWVGPRMFDVANDRRVKIRGINGQYNCWRIDAQTGTDWNISDMTVVYADVGKR